MPARAVFEGLCAGVGGFSGLLAMWLYRGYSDGALAGGGGVVIFAIVWFLPALFVFAHLVTGHAGFRWPLLAIAILQLLFGLLSFGGFFLVPGRPALSASWFAFGTQVQPPLASPRD